MRTPGEWKVGDWNGYPCVTYPVEDNNGHQFWVPQNHYYANSSTLDDARYIVTACNAHDDLLAACKKIYAYIDENGVGNYPGDVEAKSILAAAIRKAEPQESTE
jgi:hypothetical protein